MKKNLTWNEMNDKQKEKARYHWRYGTWKDKFRGLGILMKAERQVYPDAQIEYEPLNVKQLILLIALLLIVLLAMYLMAAYLIPTNIG